MIPKRKKDIRIVLAFILFILLACLTFFVSDLQTQNFTSITRAENQPLNSDW